MENALRKTAAALAAVALAWVALPAGAAWTPLTPGLEASAVGGRPTLLALPGTGSNLASAASAPRVLAVADESKEGLRLVNPDSGAQLGFVDLDSKPVALAMDSAGARAYVLTDDERLKVVDLAQRRTIASFKVGGDPRALLLREQAGQVVEVLVAQEDRDRLRGLNPANGATLRSVELDDDPAAIAWASGGTRVLVGARPGRLYVLDGASLAVTAKVRIGDEIRHLSWWEAGGLALVVHKRADGMSLVNVATGQVSAFVALDGDPQQAAVDASGERAYVTTQDDFSVNRVDLLRRALDGRYVLPEKASGSVFDPVSARLIVSQRGEGRLLRLDPAQASLVSVLELTRRLRDITVNDAAHEAVAVADKADELTRIRLSDLATATVDLPDRPRYVAVDSALNVAVVGLKSKRLRFVDLAPAGGPLLVPTQVALPDEPEALAVDSTRALAVVLTDSKRKIHFVSTAKRTLLSSISLSEDAEALAIHSGRGEAYVLTEKKKLLVVDLATRAIAQAIALNFRGNAIAVDEALDRALVTTDSDNKAHVLDLATRGILQSHTLPRRPGAVAIQADSHVAVVASSESDQISLVDLATGVATPGFLGLDKPFALAVTSRYNKALVLSAERDEVAFVQLPNPLPALEAIAPASALAGSPAIVLTLTGKHFVDSSRVYWNGTALATRWLSHTRLEADVPAGLLAAAGSAQITVRTPSPAGGTSNALAFTIGSAAPVLASVTPPSAPADGQAKTLALGGQNFASGATVLFGVTPLVATFNSPTSLGVTVPGSLTQTPGTFTVSVVNPGNRVSNGLAFTLTPALAIQSVTPSAGTVGNVIALNGIGFDPVAGNNSIAFRSASGTVPATALTATETRITVRVPPTAESGAITLTNSRGTTQSPPFAVVREQDFALVASPAAVNVYQGASNSAQLQLSSTGTQPFPGLVALSVQGLPNGATASFGPAAAISAAQPVTLTLSASAAVPQGTYPVTVRGEFVESGAILARGASLSLVVQPSAGVTGVKGRFVTPEGAGIAGVIVRADAGSPQPQTTTDAAGNFQLAGLPAGSITFRFDATPANPLYPIWPYTTTLAPNQITVIPDWTIKPPPPAEMFVPIANAAQTQVVTDPRFPGLEIRLPAGASIVGYDGVPKNRIAVEKVDLANLPVPPPPVPVRETYQLYFGTPMGGIPSAPIPVSVPNVTGLGPGEFTEIWYFDGSPEGATGEWRLAGPAVVSADGKSVSMLPGTGITRFCGVCGLFAAYCPPLPTGKPTSPDGCKSGNPIDLLSGYEMPSYSGLSCGGLVPREIGLSYNPVDGFQGRSGVEGAIGHGWVLDYDIVLADSNQAPQLKRLILPPNTRIDFSQQPDGNYANQTDPRFDGARLRLLGSTWELTFRDRRVWRFGQRDPIFATAAFLVEQVDAQGNVTTIERRSDHKITRIGDGVRDHQLSYGANSLVSEIIDPAGRSMRFTYTAERRIETMTDADGRITRYTYVGDDELPPSAVCAQGTDGRRIKTIEYPGRPTPTVNHHGPSRRVLRQVDAGGIERKFEYQVAGACVVHESTPNQVCSGTSCPSVDSWENYQAGWRIYGGQVVATTVVDAQGRRSTQQFNATGRATTSVDASGQALRLERDANNRITKRTDALGRVTRMSYDAGGNLTQLIDPLGRVTNTTYDPVWNKPTSITRFDEANQPQTWSFTYDPAKGTLLTATNPLNQTTTLAYTARGELERVTDALSHVTRFEYTPEGDLARVIDALLNETRFSSDAAGRRTATVDALNNISRTAYNGIDQLRRITDALGRQTHLAYDPAGRLESVTNARSFAIESYTYDSGDRLKSRTDAKARQTLYDYDSLGRLATMTDRRGLATTYAYDAQDRVVSVTRADGVTRFSYDAVGRLVEIADASGSISYVYDAADRVVRETQAGGGGTHIVEFAYDALDRRTSRALIGVANEVTAYGYDRANRLTSIAYRGQTTTLEYDAAGRMTKKVLPNGIKQELAYDDADRLLSITYKNPDDALVDAVFYGYDAAGRRVTESRTTNPLPDTAFTAVYDEADRMTSITFAGSGQNFLLAYDDNGNLASKTESNMPANQTLYTWDSRNRLTAIAAPGLTATFDYDALGRRSSRTANGVITRFIYDGLQAFGEIMNGEHAGLLTGLTLDEAIARYTSQGGRVFLTDALNSVLGQTRDDGSVQNYYAYSPFGEVSALGPEDGNSIQYTARENDKTGLYYYRARYYDALLKRFISEDPIGLAGGINQYGYVLNNPISLVDPTGEAFVVPILIVAALIAATQSTSFQNAAADAARYWADLHNKTDNPLYGIPGALAALADPCNVNTTAAVLGIGAGAGAYLGRPFWQYYPAGNPAYNSPWLTRGWGWKPPHQLGSEAAGKLGLPPWNPASAVRQVNPSPFEFVGGPGRVAPYTNPGYPGYYQPGGGVQYLRGGWPK